MMNRFAAMQLCPAFWNRDLTPISAACSRSASASTTKASEPPSSITVFLIPRPASAPTADPAASLPVSVTAAMRSSSTTGSIAAPPSTSVRNDAGGNPLDRNTSSIASAQPVTFEACLSTTTFPAVSAGTAARKACQYGKFHGMIANSTPSGRNAA